MSTLCAQMATLSGVKRTCLSSQASYTEVQAPISEMGFKGADL